jgi:hypothetical protein
MDKRKRDDDIHDNHIYQKITDNTTMGITHDGENA